MRRVTGSVSLLLAPTGRGAPPSAEQELALLVAGTRERRAEAEGRLRELAGRADPERLAATLDDQRLLALGGDRLLAALPDALPERFREHVAEARRLSALRSVAVDSIAQSLQQTLDERGIANLPLKGTALARRLYGDLEHRASADVDVLVRGSDLNAALAAVLERGYLPPSDPLVADGLPELHYTCEPRHDWLPQVELHWRVHWYETGFSRALLDSATDDEGGRRPAPAYDLAALLLFFARDGFIGLRYAADVAAWWDAYGDALPDGGLRGVMADHPEVATALRAAAVVSERLGGPSAAAVLGGPADLSPEAARAVSAANWTGAGDQDRRAADRAFVDWTLRPPGSTGAFARRHLRPPPQVIAKMYRLPDGAHLRRRFWSVFHGPKYALRISAAAISARRRGAAAARGS
jgi:hypothetical protein